MLYSSFQQHDNLCAIIARFYLDLNSLKTRYKQFSRLRFLDLNEEVFCKVPLVLLLVHVQFGCFGVEFGRHRLDNRMDRPLPRRSGNLICLALVFALNFECCESRWRLRILVALFHLSPG